MGFLVEVEVGLIGVGETRTVRVGVPRTNVGSSSGYSGSTSSSSSHSGSSSSGSGYSVSVGRVLAVRLGKPRV